jgi:hypothetical protein
MKSSKILCSSRIEDSGNCSAEYGCDYKGKKYSDGESFKDDCNTCTCTKDGPVCTLMLCTRDSNTEGCIAALCPVDTYCEEDENGKANCIPINPDENPCNLMDCGDGKICINNYDGTGKCVIPSTCDYNGMTHQHGESFPSDDGCNQCSCYNGQVMCTLMACISTCEYEGETYEEGASFPSSDGCNTCSCSSGRVICTKRACHQTRECKTNDDCDSEYYCEKDSCDDAAQGYCIQLLDVCADIQNPVCGCDGQTYSNACEAASEGINVEYAGECEGESQGACKTNDDCTSGHYCQKESCDDTLEGTCAIRTLLCAQIIAPVCGCDGQTYGNECEAAIAGVNVKSEGECEGETQGACKTNDDCKSEYFCSKNSCDDADEGTCAKKSEICFTLYKPVCGCDNHTYGNSCTASSSGVNVKSEGECDEKQHGNKDKEDKHKNKDEDKQHGNKNKENK